MSKLSKLQQKIRRENNLKIIHLLSEYEKVNNLVSLGKFADYVNNLGYRTIYGREYTYKTINVILKTFNYKLKNPISVRSGYFKSQGVISIEKIIACFYKDFNCISLSFITSPILLDYFDKKLKQENLKQKIIKAGEIIEQLKFRRSKNDKYLLLSFYGLEDIANYKTSLQSCISNSPPMVKRTLNRLGLTHEIKIPKVYEVNGQLIELDPIYCKPKDKNKVLKIIDNIMQEIKQSYEENYKYAPVEEIKEIQRAIVNHVRPNSNDKLEEPIKEKYQKIFTKEYVAKAGEFIDHIIKERKLFDNKETSIYDLLEEIQAKEKTSIDIIKTVLLEQDKKIKELENKLKDLL